MKTLPLQVTEVSFDFDEELSVDEQQEVINSALNSIFYVEVDDDDDDEQIAEALVEEVTDFTGWCVFSLDFAQVLNTH